MATTEISDADSSSNMHLKAEYTSPQEVRKLEHALPAISVTPSTKEKTAYLSALRSSVVKLQDEVNEFLTTKMMEDRALASTNKGMVNEKKEEENYGEEVMDEV
ncbi:hypothetical protein MMC06_005826 [Schaereria dolodes]|nr:hypothetical protein [Schaereria dolodes]